MIEMYLPKFVLKILGLVFSEGTKDRRARKALSIAVSKMNERFYQASIDYLEVTTFYKKEWFYYDYNLALAYYHLGNYKESIRYYEQALESNPEKKEDLLYNIGLAYGQLKDHVQAIQYLDQALEIYPGNHDALVQRGYSYWELKQHAPAQQDFEKVLALYPKHDYALASLGKIHLELNQPLEAIPYFDAALEINPEEAFTYKSKAQAKLALKEEKEAIQLLIKARDLWQTQGYKVDEEVGTLLESFGHSANGDGNLSQHLVE